MDKYPVGSLEYNVPLLVVSGLDSGPTKPLLTDPELKRRGILIRSELPSIKTREAKTILGFLQAADATDLPWNANDSTRKHRFKIKTIGRVRDSCIQVHPWTIS
jgi:trafficking protein particle complex subunit 11